MISLSKVTSSICALLIIDTVLAQTTRKILCLHGGGDNGNSFENYLDSPSGLARAFGPEYEFFYPSGGYSAGSNSRLWVPDPPSKDEPTTDPDIAAESVEILDQILEDHGPFYGILGYSQGSMFVSYYLSIKPPNTFEVALMFAGYLPYTHLGLLGSIDAVRPIDRAESLVWAGENDFFFYDLTLDQATAFLEPNLTISPTGGHEVPSSNDPTFDTVVDFINGISVPTPVPVPTPAPPPSSDAPSPVCSENPFSEIIAKLDDTTAIFIKCSLLIEKPFFIPFVCPLDPYAIAEEYSPTVVCPKTCGDPSANENPNADIFGLVRGTNVQRGTCGQLAQLPDNIINAACNNLDLDIWNSYSPSIVCCDTCA